MAYAPYTSPKLTILMLVSALVYPGLGILGWGGFGPFFSHPPLVALTIAGCVMFAAALFSGGNISPAQLAGMWAHQSG